jgi:hypothetical protein
MSTLRTGECLEGLRDALTTVIESEWVGIDAESANWHNLQDNLREIRETLHVCSFSGPIHDYDTEREVECENDLCHFSLFEVLIDGEWVQS